MSERERLARYLWLLIAVSVALMGAGGWVAAARADELGPPYVVAVRRVGGETSHPVQVAVDASRGLAYVVDPNTLYIFQGTQLTRTLPLGLLKMAIVDPTQGYAYLIRRESSPLVVLRGTAVLTSVDVGAVVGRAAILTPTGEVYLTLPEVDQVLVLRAGKIVTRVTVTGYPFAVTADPATRRVYIAQQNARALAVLEQHTVVNTVTLPYTPAELAVTPGADYLYVSHTADNRLTVLHRGVPTATLPLTSPKTIRVNRRTGRVYVLASDTSSLERRYGWVAVLVGKDLSATIPLGLRHEPIAVDVNPASGYVYVAAGRDEDGTVAVISGTQVLEFFEMGQTPWDVAVDVTHDLAYVPVHNARVAIFGRAVAASSPPLTSASPPVSFVCSGTHQLPVWIQIPSAAIPAEAGEVKILCSPLQEVDTAPAYRWAGQAFRIAVYRNEVNLPGFHFAQPISLSVTYDDALLGEIREEKLTLVARAGGIAAQQWMAEGIALLARNTPRNVVTATITYAADFALVGGRYPIYLPLVMRGG